MLMLPMSLSVSNKIISKRTLRRKIANNVKVALANLTPQKKSDVITNNCNRILNVIRGKVDTVRHNTNSLVGTDKCTFSFTEQNKNGSNVKGNIVEDNSNRNRVYYFNEVDNVDKQDQQHSNKNTDLEASTHQYERDFIEKLKRWAIDNNITHKSLNELIPIIHTKYPFLNRDARSILGTPKSVKTILFDNGEMLYFGLKKSLLQKLRNGFSSGENNYDTRYTIHIEINIDGIPLYNSSAQEFWPILVRSKNFVDKSPFAVGIFCGRGKPANIELFLENFIKEYSELKKDNGISYLDRVYPVEILFFSCDAPARAFLKQIMGHTSKVACERCDIQSICLNKRRFFPVGGTYNSRQDIDFLVETEFSGHIKAKSPLLDLNIGLKTKFVLDPMHLIFLGVVKRLLIGYWTEGKRPFKLSNFSIAHINQHIKNKRKYICRDFARKMRNLNDLKRWKATEYSFFLLYFGPLLLRGHLTPARFKHFLLLHSSVFIFSSQLLLDKYFNVAKNALEQFVHLAPDLYDQFFVVYNVHSLLHICEDVRLYGVLDNFSCFTFENYLGKLKKLIRGKHRPLQQINNRLEEINNICIDKEKQKIYTNIIRPLGVSDRNSNYFQCSKLLINNILLVSTSVPDNVVGIGNKVYVIVSIICLENTYKCITKKFRYQEDVYTYPINSSKLGIFYAWSEGEQKVFNVTDISCKYLTFPYKNGLYCAPILHKNYALRS